ncbi:hypothetical protein T492DRAFT_989168 [Pavlovales sp. CCMP2436]|nr:hypothetical protein T492DRAFT_989168 [Pavlovales sp. CCMP2436]
MVFELCDTSMDVMLARQRAGGDGSGGGDGGGEELESEAGREAAFEQLFAPAGSAEAGGPRRRGLGSICVDDFVARVGAGAYTVQTGGADASSADNEEGAGLVLVPRAVLALAWADLDGALAELCRWPRPPLPTLALGALVVRVRGLAALGRARTLALAERTRHLRGTVDERVHDLVSVSGFGERLGLASLEHAQRNVRVAAAGLYARTRLQARGAHESGMRSRAVRLMLLRARFAEFRVETRARILGEMHAVKRATLLKAVEGGTAPAALKTSLLAAARAGDALDNAQQRGAELERLLLRLRAVTAAQRLRAEAAHDLTVRGAAAETGDDAAAASELAQLRQVRALVEAQTERTRAIVVAKEASAATMERDLEIARRGAERAEREKVTRVANVAVASNATGAAEVDAAEADAQVGGDASPGSARPVSATSTTASASASAQRALELAHAQREAAALRKAFAVESVLVRALERKAHAAKVGTERDAERHAAAPTTAEGGHALATERAGGGAARDDALRLVARLERERTRAVLLAACAREDAALCCAGFAAAEVRAAWPLLPRAQPALPAAPRWPAGMGQPVGMVTPATRSRLPGAESTKTLSAGTARPQPPPAGTPRTQHHGARDMHRGEAHVVRANVPLKALLLGARPPSARDVYAAQAAAGAGDLAAARALPPQLRPARTAPLASARAPNYDRN